MPMSFTYLDVAKMIDHSLLNPTLTVADLEAGCRVARDYDVASACIMVGEAAPDIFCFHAGTTKGGLKGYDSGETIAQTAERTETANRALRALKPDVILVAHGAAMAAIAQLVNCLQSLFLADGDNFIVTPTYHVFAMHAAHQGADSLRTLVSSPRIPVMRNGKATSFWGLNGAASLKERRLVVTMVNPSVTDARETEIALRGATAKSARVTLLTASEMNAHNTFESPDAVAPSSADARISGSSVVLTVPSKAVAKVEIELS